MSLVTRYSVPRMVQVGLAQSLTMDVYDADTQAQATPTAATLEAFDGPDTILAETAGTGGAPSSYSLLAATTSGRAPSETWLEVWRLTVGGNVHTVTRTGYLCRRIYVPTLTQNDLYRRHPRLSDMMAEGQTSWADIILDTTETLERRIIAKGRRPHLIFDTWALRDCEIALALHLIFRDLATSIGDGRYADLDEKYREEFEREFERVKFRYDSSETGTVDTADQKSSVVPLIITAGVQRWSL